MNKALLGSNENLVSYFEVEEAKALLRLVPIWCSCLIYPVMIEQAPTFFTKQGTTMERTIVSGFEIPAATLQSIIFLTVLILIPIYDRIFIPIARSFTKKPSGITMLQRIGTGMFLSTTSMIVAALVEMKRLKTAQQYSLIDMPRATIPMSIWWLVPQYLLFGIANVFTMVGLQEFFYDQVPNEIRSIGLALNLSIFGVGSFLSSFLVSAIDKATGPNNWFSNNLNQAHLDNFYWLLSGLSVVGLSAYLYFARSYMYK